MKSKFATAIIVVTHVLLIAFTTYADDNSWTASSGKWETGSNWSLSVPPTNTQSTVLITNDTTKTVTIDATTSGSFPGMMVINSLLLSEGTGSTNTLFLSNAGPGTPVHTLAGCSIGNGGNLLVTNSALHVDGALTIDGSMTLLDGIVLAGATSIDGEGELTIASGHAEISSDLQIVGSSMVRVAGGQLVSTNATIHVGHDNQGSGEISVSNATMLAGFIFIGQGTDAKDDELRIADGAVVSSSGISVDTDGSVWVAGGQLIANSGITLGGFSNGKMIVSNGTVLARVITLANQGSLLVAGGAATVVSNFNLAGTATVSGGSLIVTNGMTYIGPGNNGNLTISNGVMLARDASIGIDIGAQAAMTVVGGTVNFSSNVVIGACEHGLEFTLGFNGAPNPFFTQLVTVPHSNDLYPPSALTVECWIKPESVGGEERFLGNFVSSNDGYYLGINNGNDNSGAISFVMGTSSGSKRVSGTTDVRDGRFHHVAGVWDGTAMHVFVDGVQEGTAALSGPPSVGSGDFAMGAMANKQFAYGGELGEMRVSSVARYGSNFSPARLFTVDASTVAYWSLIEGDGNTVIDQTANHHDGTPIGGFGGPPGYVPSGGNGGGTVIVTGGNLVVTNAAHDATIEVKHGLLILDGGVLRADRLVVTNDCGVLFVRGSGTLIVGELVVDPSLTVPINSWTDGDGKWEAGNNWSSGQVPTNNDWAEFITNATSKVITIDATTAGSFPGATTISNLTLSAPHGSTNTLYLNNAGLVVPLHITDSFTIGSGGDLLVTNSSLLVDGPLILDGRATIVSGQLLASNMYVGWAIDSDGMLTIAGGTVSLLANVGIGVQGTGTVWITGGRLVATNGTIQVGAFVGDMTVSNGSVLADSMYIGDGEGILRIIGGTTSVSSELTVSGVGFLWMTGGELDVTNGTTFLETDDEGGLTVSNGTFFANRLYLDTGGSLTLAGGTTTLSSVQIDAGTVQVTGGDLTINGGTSLGSDLSHMTLSNVVVLLGSMDVAGGSSFTLVGGKTSLSSHLGVEGGGVWVTGGQMVVTNDSTFVFNGEITVSNGTLLAGFMFVGEGTDGGGGTLKNAGGTTALTSDLTADNNGMVWVTGGQLLSTNTGTRIRLGNGGAGAMTVSNGTVFVQSFSVGEIGSGTLAFEGGAGAVSSNLVIGDCNGGGSGTLIMDAGGLFVINNAHNATLDVSNGQLILNGGLLWVDRLVITNSCGVIVRGAGTLIADELVLDPSLDADGDGLPNGWEQNHGFDPLNTADGQSGSTNSWTSGSGKWETGGDWSLGVPPAITQFGILITNDGGKTVTIDALTASDAPNTMVIRDLTLSAPTDSTNTLLLSDAGTNIPVDVLNASIGSGGELHVTNSSVLVGGSLDVNGRVTLDGGSISVTNGTTSLGNGQMTVSNGTVRARDVQMGANATLTVAGGAVTLASDLNINDSAAVWVTGGELTITNGTTTFYRIGGQITVSNGTVVLAGLMYIGEGTHSSDGVLTVAGGTVSFTSDLVVADRASVNVAGGALMVTNGALTIGTGVDYHGANVTVSSGEVVAVSIGLGLSYVGDALTIEDGTVNVYSNMSLGSAGCNGDGEIVIDGGSVFVTNAEHDAVLEISAGTVTLNAGQLTVDRLVMTDPCASFVHNGGTLVYGTAVLDPVRDDDGDGIPNGYEQGHGLDPLNATDADLDNDGDGMSNLQEYLAGTDPNDASSAFRITGIAREGADMRITWTTGSGRTNALQVATDSVTGTFSDAFIVTDTVAAVTNYLDVGATLQSRRFYRVWLVP